MFVMHSALHAGAKSATSSHGDKAHAEKEAVGGGGGLGPRWPKGLWDNSDGKHGLAATKK